MKAASASANSALAAAYRATFQEYSNKLERLQTLMFSPGLGAGSDPALIEAALLEVEASRIAHSCARDRLARELIRSTSSLGTLHCPRAIQSRIRQTARLLWEVAGCPEGTAESDWYKAEKVVRTAAAAC
ncbi:MAG: DUF2934 domain-containing protein [Acidobacteriota bacterium]|nr:DUF2934 domain-containing protein [Acidobacteriota bacterium]